MHIMKQKVSFWEAIVILAVLLLLLSISVINLRLQPTVPIMFTIGLLIIWAKFKHFAWQEIDTAIKDGISVAIIPIFIFLLIGALISLWIKSGTIPTIMYLGFRLISGNFLLPSVFLVCSIIGVAIGSGFTTISTVGIALFGIGISLKINPGLVAGAIISGAVFGDKMSPLSDSTNLAAAVAESELFAHVKNMLWSTVPAFLVSLILYTIFNQNSNISFHALQGTISALQSDFSLSYLTLLPILLMFICARLKIPAIPTLFGNIFLTVILIIVQEPTISLTAIIQLISNGYVAATPDAALNALLTRGGIASMMNTVALIITTLALGGLLMHFAIIQSALTPLSRKIKRTFPLVLLTICSSIAINLLVGEQYLSIILPGRAFKAIYKQQHISGLTLSRALEDGGSVINYLVPWAVAGSFAAGTLGLAVSDFLPYTFFSLFSPLFSLISAATGLGLKKDK